MMYFDHMSRNTENTDHKYATRRLTRNADYPYDRRLEIVYLKFRRCFKTHEYIKHDSETFFEDLIFSLVCTGIKKELKLCVFVGKT